MKAKASGSRAMWRAWLVGALGALLWGAADQLAAAAGLATEQSADRTPAPAQAQAAGGAPATEPAVRPPAPANDADAAAIAPEDRWYVLELMGQRAGWMHAKREINGHQVHSTSTMQMSIQRGAAGVEVRVSSVFVETLDGKPLRMTSRQKLAAMETVEEIEFAAGKLKVSSTQGGRRTEREEPWPAGEWLTPAAAERFVTSEVAAGKQRISLRTLDPSLGLTPVAITRTIVGRENVRVLGKTVPAIKWTVTMDRLAGVESTEFADERGRAVRSEMSIGGLSVVQLLADKDLAMAPTTGPELLVSTLVKPDRPLPNARALRQAEYLVSVKEGTLPDLPGASATGGGQRFERIDQRTGRVVVDLDATTGAAVDQAEAAAAVGRSRMIDGTDPVVSELLTKAGGGRRAGESDAALAERLRAFVYRSISAKNMSVGFATAGETARTLEGDCTEHAVLLAAIMRAAGLPARVVTGLIYVEEAEGARQVFGFHMWTQALLTSDGAERRWSDYDATLPGGVRFDAAHIALGHSALTDEDTTNALVATAPLLGRMVITVVRPAK
jgi:hypothetical protein